MSKLYCHSDLIMFDGECSAIAGKLYQIINKINYSIYILDEQEESHSFSTRDGSDASYKRWFWKLTDKEYIKHIREEKLKKLGIIK